jgi:putative membrane protein
LAITVGPIVALALMTWVFWEPEERLNEVTAAIVNQDEPVTIDGQILPLGRQLAAALVDGAGGHNPTYHWIMTTADDAGRGLDRGDYAVAVTVPSGFSKAATSLTGPPLDAREATIDVTSSVRSTFLDDTIAQAIIDAAAKSLAQQVTETYLSNIYLGFATIHDQLGQAAAGAATLADGTGQAASGAVDLANGTGQALAGADQLAQGTAQLAAGAAELATQSGLLASGTTQIAQGMDQLSAGLGQLSGGLSQLSQLIDLLHAVADPLGQASATVAEWAERLQGNPAAQAEFILQLGRTCVDQGADPDFCAELQSLLESALADPQVAQALDLFLGLVDRAALAAGGLAFDANNLATSLGQAQRGAADLYAGSLELASNMHVAATGTVRAAAGAAELEAGLRSAADGAGQVSSGLGQLHTGALTLADAAARLDAGAEQLSAGLSDATDQVPSYSDAEQDRLKATVTDPIEAQAAALKISGTLALYATFALWLGSIATFLVIRPTPRDAVGTRRSALRSALRCLAPGVGVALCQGVLVGVAVGVAAAAPAAQIVAVVAACVGLAVAFTAVGQALTTLFGNGLGGVVAMAVAGLAGLTAIVSGVPPIIRQIADVLPTAPARSLIHAALGGPGNLGGAALSLVLWGLAGLAATTLAVGRTRCLNSRRLWSDVAAST